MCLLYHFSLLLLVSVHFSGLKCELLDQTSSTETVIKLKVGVLVGRQGVGRGGGAHPWLARQLMQVFNYGIDKINLVYSRMETNASTSDIQYETPANKSSLNNEQLLRQRPKISNNNNRKQIKFLPVLAETFGNEAESIRQTINLILDHRVNAIIGPQGTACEMEPHLASIYNVPMISHCCVNNQPDENDEHDDERNSDKIADQFNRKAATFIQTKPPYWKIVKRVVTLIERLLDSFDGYSPNLVLLYYKAKSSSSSSSLNHASSSSSSSSLVGGATHGAGLGPKFQPPASDKTWLSEHDDQRRDQSISTKTNTPAHHLESASRATLQQRGIIISGDGKPRSTAKEKKLPLVGNGNGRNDNSGASSGAIQYRLIGELLEVKLKRLLQQRSLFQHSGISQTKVDRRRQQELKTSESSSGRQKRRRHSLAVLNWHTTFHYGLTKNPFRAPLRRHLLNQWASDGNNRAAPSTNQNNLRCSGTTMPLINTRNSSDYQRFLFLSGDAAGNLDSDEHGGGSGDGRKTANRGHESVPPATTSIYVVVGHYWEHLGLMLSLDEFGLLNGDNGRLGVARSLSFSFRNVESRDEKQSLSRSVVVGVDIEPYDGEDWRGPLMGGAGGSDEISSSANARQADLSGSYDSNSAASLYDHYIGIMPTKPLSANELIASMLMSSARQLYNGTSWQSQQQTPINDQRAHGSSSAGNAGRIDTTSVHVPGTNRTATNHESLSAQQQSTLTVPFNPVSLKLLSWPLEAFYLYDAIILLGSYFNQCLQRHSPGKCNSGKNVFDWFANRHYTSCLDNKTNGSRFDSLAQADGSYTILARKQSRVEDTSVPMDTIDSGDEQRDSDLSNDEEFRLIPIGRFAYDEETDSQVDIELQVDSNELSSIWLPFWCFNQLTTLPLNKSAPPECESLLNRSKLWPSMADSSQEYRHPMQIVLGLMISLVAICYCFLRAISYASAGYKCCFYGIGVTEHQLTTTNENWFSEQDERNFLKLVQSLLLTPGIGDHSTDHYADGMVVPKDESHAICMDILSSSNATHSSVQALSATTVSSVPQSKELLLGERRKSCIALSAGVHYDANEDVRGRSQESCLSSSKAFTAKLVDLHCYMFAFPSCKFVHWLEAMLKLKEMLFKYQSNLNGYQEEELEFNRGPFRCEDFAKSLWLLVSRRLETFRSLPDFIRQCCLPTVAPAATQVVETPYPFRSSAAATKATAKSSSLKFFTRKHKGTATVRLLLNKYKSLNECLCNLRDLVHPSIVRLHGVTLSYEQFNSNNKLAQLILEQPLESRGNLRQIIERIFAADSRPSVSWNRDDDEDDNDNEVNAQLLGEFKTLLLNSMLLDLINGLEYLHDSGIQYHGELRTTTCLLTSDWRLKLSGFHVKHMRDSLGYYEMKNFQPTVAERCATTTPGAGGGCGGSDSNSNTRADCFMDQLVYAAPEILSNQKVAADSSGVGNLVPEATITQAPTRTTTANMSAKQAQLADIYSFAYVLYELVVGREPWVCLTGTEKCAKLIVERVRVDPRFRPPLSGLDSACAWLMSKHLSNNTSEPGSTPPPGIRNETRSRKRPPTELNSLLSTKWTIGSSYNDTTRSPPPSLGIDLEALRSLFESCWSSEPSHRPQSVWILRQLLAGSMRTPIPLSCSSISDETNRQVSSRYTRLTERALQLYSERLVELDQKLINLRLVLLPKRMQMDILRNGHACNHNGLASSPGSAPLSSCFSFLSTFASPATTTTTTVTTRATSPNFNNNNTGSSLSPISGQRFNHVSFCAFRFVLMQAEPAPGAEEASATNCIRASGDLEVLIGKLNQVLRQIDELVASYRGQVQLLDSQADSMLRHLVYAGGPLSMRTTESCRASRTGDRSTPATINERQANNTRRRQHATKASLFSFNGNTSPERVATTGPELYNSTQILTSFALQLIDLANKFADFVQIRCALHCGPAVGYLLPVFCASGGGGGGGELTARAGELHAAPTNVTQNHSLTRYVLLGKAMQVADLLEQTSQFQRIHISAEYRSQLIQNNKNSTRWASSSGSFAADLLAASPDARNSTRLAQMLGAGCTDPSSITNLPTSDLDNHIGGDCLSNQQSYIIIKRGNRMSMRSLLAGSELGAERETYWLLNGPRLSASQKLMLSLDRK